MKKRLCKVVYTILGFLSIGLIYSYFIIKTGIYIPCLFRTVTGYKCPGCGISHFCINILKYIFTGFDNQYLSLAFWSNPFIFIISPIVFIIGVYKVSKWVLYGTKKETKSEKFIIYLLCILIIIWGIVRNIIGL